MSPTARVMSSSIRRRWVSTRRAVACRTCAAGCSSVSTHRRRPSRPRPATRSASPATTGGPLTAPLNAGARHADSSSSRSLPDGRRGRRRSTRRRRRPTSTLPFFGWAIGPLVATALQRDVAPRRRDASRPRSTGREPPPPPKGVAALPDVGFDPAQAALLSADRGRDRDRRASAAALFGQNSSFIADAFHASDARLGGALAISRAGVLVSLVATALVRPRRPPAHDPHLRHRRVRHQPRCRRSRRASRRSPRCRS